DLDLDVGLDLARRLDGADDLAAGHGRQLDVERHLAVEPPLEQREVRVALEVGRGDRGQPAGEGEAEQGLQDCLRQHVAPSPSAFGCQPMSANSSTSAAPWMTAVSKASPTTAKPAVRARSWPVWTRPSQTRPQYHSSNGSRRRRAT